MRMALDKREGSVKDKDILGSAEAPLFPPVDVRGAQQEKPVRK
jgi:hypothetical protein